MKRPFPWDEWLVLVIVPLAIVAMSLGIWYASNSS